MRTGAMPRLAGLALLFGACACSLLVDTSAIDEGCGAGKKICAGKCVKNDDPTYGCGPSTCTRCPGEHSIPKCDEAGECEVDTCLYGWGCSDCSAQILTDPDNCGSCGARCADGLTCSVGECVDSPAGAGGQASGGAP